MSRALVVFAALTGCTAPPEAFELDDAPADHEERFAGYRTEPRQGALPDVAVHYARALGPAVATRGRGLTLFQDIGGWIEDNTGEPCPSAPPELPAVSADGSVLAIGVGSSVHLDFSGIWVRLYRTGDGTLLGERRVVGRREHDALFEDESNRPALHRRLCRRAAGLNRLMAPGHFEPMPVVGAWADPIGAGLAKADQPWSQIVCDDATRERDEGDDIVIARPGDHPQLHLHPGDRDGCDDLADERSAVWATDTVSVWERGTCGC